MAWIESHQELARHPKIKRLARSLGLRNSEIAHHVAISLLHHLWWWAMDYAEDGVLDVFSAEDIADACQWTAGKADALITSLVDSGWLDRDGESLRVHDYEHYIARLLQRREQNAERARTSRARHAHAARNVSAACGATGTGTGTFRAAHATAGADAQRLADAEAKAALDRAIALANYIDPIDPTLPPTGGSDA